MTGFGAAEGAVAGGTLRIEVKSVNHRYLSLALKAPSEIATFEAEIRDRLRRDFERGHFTVAIRWLQASSAAAGGLTVDPAGARAAHSRLTDLAAAAGVSAEVSLDLLARQPEVFTAVTDASTAIEWGVVAAVLAPALTALVESRRREGGVLASELIERIRLVRELGQAVAQRAPERVAREHERLRSAVAQLLDGRPVDEQRVAQEIAFLAERLDITEELVRLGAHLDACEAALSGTKAVGKQLGFLAQELGREVNTIGSKANDAAMQHLVVDMKGELERFREQLENLE